MMSLVFFKECSWFSGFWGWFYLVFSRFLDDVPSVFLKECSWSFLCVFQVSLAFWMF